MELKKYFEESGLSKTAFAKECGITWYKLDKYLKGEQEVPQSILNKFKPEVTVEEELPVVDFYEDIFLKGIKKDTWLEKISGISFTRFVFTSDKAKHRHKDRILQGKEPNDIVERLCKAILLGKWQLKAPAEKVYVIKMPTGHHLACVNVEGKDKYVYSYSVDDFTVKGSKEELGRKFPAYSNFITELTDSYVDQMTNKFKIRQRGQ